MGRNFLLFWTMFGMRITRSGFFVALHLKEEL
ncbi:unnamed protein product [Linum tenue]|uniref:Uncharacterized protein n=1 Tax=Linum tenue TaxID=586396 RepID=A0AAV0KE36_9ROSI|nr:unnamed protein product [Linum tenue]